MAFFQQPSLLQYIPPRLVEGKEWYICYYAIHPETNCLRRVKIKFNRIKNLRARRKSAKLIMDELNKKLSAGWTPFLEQQAPKSFHSLFDVLDTYLRMMKKEAEPHSYRSYKSYIKYLITWLYRNGYDKTFMVAQFNSNMASDIMLEIRESDRYSYRTYNNYLQFFVTLFNWMMQWNYLGMNPFLHIKKIPKKMIKKTRTILSDENREQLFNFLLEQQNYNYLSMCLLCYYCFIRPNELSLLRVRDIHLDKQLIYVSEAIAKNDHSSWRTIPDVAMPYIRMLKLSGNPDEYLFSADKHFKFIPGVKRAEGREIARYWSDVIRPGLKWPMSLQFYSLKDTGITNLLADGVAPNFVQGQADHSSLSVTSIYAKKVTPRAQEDIRKKAGNFNPEL